MVAMASTHPVAFAPHQQRWIESEAVFTLWRKSRRIGADYCDAYKRVSLIMRGLRDRDVNYSTNKMENAREYIEYVKHFARMFNAAIEVTSGVEYIGDEELQTYRVIFPETATRKRVVIRAMSSNPSAARGLDGDFVISELAWHPNPEEMLGAAVPCTSLGGRLAILSTVNEAGDYFDELTELGLKLIDPETHGELLDDDMRIELHTTSIHDAATEGWSAGNSFLEIINRTRGTSYTPESFITEIRQKTPRHLFPREYELVSDSNADSYFPWTTIIPAVNQSLPQPLELTRPIDQNGIAYDTVWSARARKQVRELLARISEAYCDAGTLFAGIDVGRTQDKFSLTVGRKVGERVAVVGQLRWRNMTFADMQRAGDAVLEFVGPNAKRVLRQVSDRTGLGMQMAEHWERAYPVRAEGIDFSNTNKEIIATYTRSMFDQRLLAIPDDRDLKAQTNSIRETRTATGKPRYAGERTTDGHADAFWSLAAMLHAAHSVRSEPRGVPGGTGVLV